MMADDSTRSELLAVMTQWAQAYTRKEVDTLLDLCVPDDSLLMVGTGDDEVRVGRESFRAGLERDFAQCSNFSLSYSDLHAFANGDAAWICATCQARATVGAETIALSGRYTAVLEKRDGRWLFAHAHLSVPDAAQEAGQSFPTPDAG